MDVVIAILVKNKETFLDLFLRCIEEQTWPKENTLIYIKTNNNTDNSVNILKAWVEKMSNKYKEIYFNSEDENTNSSREWDSARFKILGKIRQDSVKYAIEKNASYFVVDADNFICEDTIEKLMAIRHIGVVAPFLVLPNKLYSNYHNTCDENGYMKPDDQYYTIWNRVIKGLIKCDVVHCSYLISNEFLEYVKYDDNSYRYEYVIFSDFMRKSNVDQFIDNRKIYGSITFTEDKDEFSKELKQHLDYTKKCR